MAESMIAHPHPNNTTVAAVNAPMGQTTLSAWVCATCQTICPDVMRENGNKCQTCSSFAPSDGKEKGCKLDEIEPRCGFCNLPGTKDRVLKRCACQTAWYCNADHQKKARKWHKPRCFKPGE